MGYVYRPKSAKKRARVRRPQKTHTTSSKEKDQNKKYIHTIVKYNLLSLGIVVVSLFSFWLVFSNINNLWGIFRPSETYIEENKDKPAKPFLQANTEFTNQDTVNLEGVAGEGQKIILYKNNNQEAETIASGENKFSFDSVGVSTNQDSSTIFYVVSRDDKGNESEPSNEITVVYDNKKPELSISEPKQDDRIKSFSRSLEVKGTTEENTTVTINGKIAKVNQNNDYSAVIRLENEVNVIKVEAEDRAGNKSIQEVAIYFEKIED